MFLCRKDTIKVHVDNDIYKAKRLIIIGGDINALLDASYGYGQCDCGRHFRGDIWRFQQTDQVRIRIFR